MAGWELHPGGDLPIYAIGVIAGDRVRLRRELVIREMVSATPTGPVHKAGEIWRVLQGCSREPDTIWLAEPDGVSHTWDAESFYDWFEVVPRETG